MIEVTITKEIVNYIEEHKNRERYSVIYQKDFEVKEGDVWYLEGISQSEGNVMLRKKTDEGIWLPGFWLPMYFVPQESVGNLLDKIETRKMREDFQEKLKDVDWIAYRLETAKEIAIALIRDSAKSVQPFDYDRMMKFAVSQADLLIKELRTFKKE